MFERRAKRNEGRRRSPRYRSREALTARVSSAEVDADEFARTAIDPPRFVCTSALVGQAAEVPTRSPERGAGWIVAVGAVSALAGALLGALLTTLWLASHA